MKLGQPLALAAALSLAPLAQAYVFQPDASGAAQRATGEIPYSLNQGGSRDLSYDKLLPAVHAAFDTWASQSQGAFSFTDQGPTTLGPPAQGEARLGLPVTVSFETQSWNYVGDDQAVAILVEDPTTHEILRADIVFNEVTHHWAILGDGEEHPGADDVQNTLTHEVGHLLGFGHPDDTASTMFADTHPGEVSKRTLDAQDLAGVAALYEGPKAPAEQTAGCSTGGGGVAALAWLALAWVLARRRHFWSAAVVRPP